MNTYINEKITALDEKKAHVISELIEFLSIPSVSTQPKHRKDVRLAAEFVKNKLVRIGISDARLMETKGLPIVFGTCFISSELPTILIYGHYDVQPADDLENWTYSPFTPTIVGDSIYARGACDDKLQMMIPITSVGELLISGKLGYNIKFLFEGEEEVGSVSLKDFIIKNKVLLHSDACLVVDTFMQNVKTPAIYYGLKGAITFELEVKVANKDLHSGLHGGIAKNAVDVLSGIIHSFKDREGKVNVCGFYENQIAISSEEMEWMNRVAVLEGLAVGTVHTQWNEPTLEFNGISSGYTGEGVKTIIPCQAKAKFSVRTVNGQIAEDVISKIQHHIQKQMSPECSFSLKANVACVGYASHNHWLIENAKKVCNLYYNEEVVMKRMGGSIPAVSFIYEVLGVSSLLLGFGLESDNIHAPNEHYRLSQFFKGVDVIEALLSV